MKNRDKRLAQTIRSVGYTRIDSDKPLLPDLEASMTGYQIAKFISKEAQDGDGASYQDVAIIRYAEVLLNYAEAKAELGILTQDDIDKSIRPIRTRAGMPNLNQNIANSNPDKILASEYPNVSGNNKGVILEIRRERRVELALEGFRYDDLMRWKMGNCLNPTSLVCISLHWANSIWTEMEQSIFCSMMIKLRKAKPNKRLRLAVLSSSQREIMVIWSAF